MSGNEMLLSGWGDLDQKIAQKKRHERKVVLTKEERDLLLLLEGLMADGEIVPSEVKYLDDWLRKREVLGSEWPCDVLHYRIKKMLDDGVMDVDEQRKIVNIIAELKDPRPRSFKKFTPDNVPYNDPAPVLSCSQAFCLTGEFRVGKRDHCIGIIEKYGGVYLSSVRRHDCVLVVGDLGWDKTEPYSSKVRKAVEFREQEASVAIVKEQEWWMVFGEHCKIE